MIVVAIHENLMHMTNPLNDQFIDLVVVVCANIFNLMMVAIFLLRTSRNSQAEKVVGILQFPLGLILAGAVFYNLIQGRGLWWVVLPALMVVFILIELLFDYILQLNFRQSRLLGPYLLFYYSAQMGLIGYAFLVNRNFGMITLLTYFMSLGATGYSYSKVGHGRT